MAKNQPTGTYDPTTGAFVRAKKKHPVNIVLIIVGVLALIAISRCSQAAGNESAPDSPETESAETAPAEPEADAPETDPPETEAPAPETEAPETDPPPTPEEIRADYIASCTAPSYEEIMRRPDEYRKKPVTATGEAVQVLEETHLFTGTTVNIRLEDDNGDVWLLIYNKSAVETPNGNVLEGDRLTVYGDCTGTTSYKTILGKQITVPSVSVKYMTEG